ncbi:MAG: 6-phosphofructokinase isozyme 2 [Firmicutes bacterium ADurb.Bin467]|nr:MAG: 6-phosphofructokinase isozyme 2 [Firmicutes bacterium ADurb.Bin467]
MRFGSDTVIATVCLNPSIDHMLQVENFKYGGLNRVAGERFDAGGKGVNVAVALSALGLDAECVAFMHRESARTFEARLLKSGTTYEFVWLEGRTRTNLKVFDEAKGAVTEFNGSGRPVSDADLRRMAQLVAERAEGADTLILSGSLPPNCPEEYYAELIRAVDGLGCRVILDADGAPLRHGIAAKPYLVKPNRHELEALAGRTLETREQVRDAARELIGRGVSVVAVSLGSGGAVIADRDEAWFAPALDVEVRSTVGAGDAMVAGLAAGLLMDAELERVFAMGVASASAMCMTEGTDALSRADYKRLLEAVRPERI